MTKRRRMKAANVGMSTALAVLIGISFLTIAILPRLESVEGFGEVPQLIEVVVQPGDTLWLIAKDNVPDADPRQVVWEIRQQNGLPSATVYPGQVLRVPVNHGESFQRFAAANN